VRERLVPRADLRRRRAPAEAAAHPLQDDLVDAAGGHVGAEGGLAGLVDDHRRTMGRRGAQGTVNFDGRLPAGRTRAMTDRSAYPTRKARLGEELPDELADVDAAARLEMVWHLTLQAWAFKGLDHEPRLRRDVGRVIRGRSGLHGDRRARGGGVRAPARDG
jgi:hypothetical protein